MNDKASLEIRRMGLTDFTECWELQKSLQRQLIDGTGRETLLLCSHPPIITLGRSTKPEHLPISLAELQHRGLKIFEIERGGSVTYHGPEQLVAYPIINLSSKRKDVGWYMRQLEEVIIRTAVHLDIQAERVPNMTGVWVKGPKGPQKLAFIGVRISRWVTLHGLSINLSPCAEPFSLINPCGLGNILITSLEELCGRKVDRHQAEDWLIAEFCEVFGMHPVT